LLTFLGRTQELPALSLAPAVRQAAVQAEGLRRRPERLAEAGSAAAFRGVLLAASVVLTQSGAEGSAAVVQVRDVPRLAWRAGRLVECLNRVARMQQVRHRRVTPGLLSLKRGYWNRRPFRTGRRRKQTP
jgi:hypothetical protein